MIRWLAALLISASLAQVGSLPGMGPSMMAAPGAASGGNSLIFNGSSQYLSKSSPSAALSQLKGTINFWYKLTAGNNGSQIAYYNYGGSLATSFYALVATNGSTYTWNINLGNGSVLDLITNTFTQDTAWHNFNFAYDATQATAANRAVIYVDGTAATYSTAVYPNQFTGIAWNNTNTVQIGKPAANLEYFNGKLTNFYYVDGQSLAPSSFISGTPGVPISYTGTWGYWSGCGFLLNFAQGTSTTTLGYDASGSPTNLNNWTLNGMTTGNQSSSYPGGGAGNSLTFNGTSQYLSNFGNTHCNQQQFTISFWYKLAATGAQRQFMVWGKAGYYISFALDSSEHIFFNANNGGSIVLNLTTSTTYTDTTNWHNVTLAIDLTQATSTNRAILYYDGTAVTAGNYSTYTVPAQNTSLQFNQGGSFGIGWNELASSYYFDGSLAQFYYIDGQGLAASNFITGTPGNPSAFTGNYSPINAGVNLFLPFSNGASTTTLGYDGSPTGYNWTLNNMTTANQSTDYP